MQVSQPPQQPEQELGPLVTVIIVSYRRGAVLRQCLQALAKSEQRKRLQPIVLDLGNHDTTTDWDHDFPDVTFLRIPRNFGATKALNIGIRSAKAELLFFLDPAVLVLPGTIPGLVPLLENDEVGAVCPLLVDEQGNPVPQVRSLPSPSQLWSLWEDEAAVEPSVPAAGDAPYAVEYPGRKALLVPLPFLKGMNYFDGKYGEWGADLELAYQIQHAGKKPFQVPALKAVDTSASETKPALTSGQRALLAADRLHGAAHFLAKRAGFVSGLLMQIRAVLVTLLRAITFQDPSYNWSLFMSLLSGQRIDGSQGSL